MSWMSEKLIFSLIYEEPMLALCLALLFFIFWRLNMRPTVGPLELLVMQPTPYCNLDCSYCYLPNRSSRRRMSIDTMREVFRWVFASDIVQDSFCLLWHAGEPLVLPRSYYENAIECLKEENFKNLAIKHSIQTNATLIDEAWCEFLKKHDFHIGVSLDGPEFLHDRHRKDRQLKGSFAKTIRGIELLHKFEIPFQVLAVVTEETLSYPDELYDVLRQYQIEQIGLNCEEIEGPNVATSLDGVGTQERLLQFFKRFFYLCQRSEPEILVREVEDALTTIYDQPFLGKERTSINQPFSTLNVDCEGNFSTYSPELLGHHSERYGDFSLGNIRTHRLDQVIKSSQFKKMDLDVAKGIQACQKSCQYFRFCGGGPVGNKYFEKKTFSCAETLSCKLQLQTPVEAVLAMLEKEQNLREA